MENTAEVQSSDLSCLAVRSNLNEICSTDDILQAGEAHGCQIFSYFLSQELEVIDQVLIVSAEVFTQFFILSGNTYRT